MSQLQRPDQGPGMGRGQRPQGEAAPEADQGERRLPRADDHRGADPVWRDGRLVSHGEEVRQVLGVRLHQVADQRRDQGRGAGAAQLNRVFTIKSIFYPVLFCGHCVIFILQRLFYCFLSSPRSVAISPERKCISFQLLQFHYNSI